MKEEVKKEVEAEAEAELIILKEKIVKRNQDRSYLDRSRGGNPEIWRPKSEQKRKAEWDDDLSSTGSWQTSQKRARKSAGWSLSLFAQFAHFSDRFFLQDQDPTSRLDIWPMNIPRIFI